MTLGAFLSGSTVTETARFLDIAGISHYSPGTMTTLNQQIRKLVVEETDQVLEREIERVVSKWGTHLSLKLDFTWNCRLKGKLGTLTCVSAETNKPIFRKHVLSVGSEANYKVCYPSTPG